MTKRTDRDAPDADARWFDVHFVTCQAEYTELLMSVPLQRGWRVLDAGCGEGYLARVLAARGARVTGIDLSPRLVELARQRTPDGDIEYRIGDLSVPSPEDVERFLPWRMSEADRRRWSLAGGKEDEHTS